MSLPGDSIFSHDTVTQSLAMSSYRTGPEQEAVFRCWTASSVAPKPWDGTTPGSPTISRLSACPECREAEPKQSTGPGLRRQLCEARGSTGWHMREEGVALWKSRGFLESLAKLSGARQDATSPGRGQLQEAVR